MCDFYIAKPKRKIVGRILHVDNEVEVDTRICVICASGQRCVYAIFCSIIAEINCGHTCVLESVRVVAIRMRSCVLFTQMKQGALELL